jgi:hypothetical protein
VASPPFFNAVGKPTPLPHHAPYHLDIDESSLVPPVLQVWDRLKKWAPVFCRVNVVFCATPKGAKCFFVFYFINLHN